jgi:hypothetical protein
MELIDVDLESGKQIRRQRLQWESARQTIPLLEPALLVKGSPTMPVPGAPARALRVQAPR